MNVDEREATIRRLLPLVRAIARRVRRVVGLADLGDLVGDGSIGLIRAVDTFDATRGTSLERYARRLVVGAMLNGMRRRDPVSERVRRKLRRAENERYALAQVRGTLPTLGEMERRDASLRRARLAVHEQTAVSIDAPTAGGTSDLPRAQNDTAAAAIARVGRRDLAQAIALLPERQRRILALHYSNEMTLHAISTSMRVSPQRVSQLHLAALHALRHGIAEP